MSLYFSESDLLVPTPEDTKTLIALTNDLPYDAPLPPSEPLDQKSAILKDPADFLEDEALRESPTTRETFTFKCIFCDAALTGLDEPKLLECLHNACGGCIRSKFYDAPDKSRVECPQCGIACDPGKFIDNQFLVEAASSDEASARLAEMKCSSCDDAAAATSWCVECAEYICDGCVQAHQRLKITKEHTIKPKEDSLDGGQAPPTAGGPSLFCTAHPHEKLSLFCETCDKLTCRDCQLIEHREHKYKFTKEIALDTRKFIADMLKDVEYKRSLLFSAMKVIDDRQALIVEKKQALVKEITQLVVKLTNTINVRGKQLVGKLNEVCDGKQQTLEEKKQALDQLSSMTDHCILFTQYALDNGSDMALLYTKKQVASHLKRIKCRRADIPNPEIPVRIHLALDKVPELVKVMSSIGQIVVDGRVYPSLQQQGSATTPPSPHHSSPSPGTSRSPSSAPSPIGLPPPPSYPINSNNSNYTNLNQQQQQQQQQPAPQTQQQSQRLLPSTYGNQFNLRQQIPNQTSHPTMQNQSFPNQQQQQTQRPLVPHLTNSLSDQLRNYSQIFAQKQTSQQVGPQHMQPRYMGPNQQQVSSSTHPQNQNRSNLRGLLQPANNPVYIQTGPAQYQAVQPHVAQHYQNRFPRNSSEQVTYHQQQQQQQHQQNMIRSPLIQQRPVYATSGNPTRWHIPQQPQTSLLTSNNGRGGVQPMDDSFKITLKRQQQQANFPATVTSTIPKTPSPNHVTGGRSDTERNLDKFCEDSVKDLMATIAKLDSNGVKVVAEGRKTGGSPQVDSSTGDAVGKKGQQAEAGKDDPNEDWCAVCMDGGELVCCDRCPKVFHQYCHIPNLSVEENDTWQCLLCTNFADLQYSNERKEGELSAREKKVAERILLELYCQYDPSLPFREIIGPDNEAYHSIIKNPVALDTIRQKINWNSPDQYATMELFLRDIRIMFKNAYIFNPEDSQIYADAKTLEKFFDEQMEKFLPEYLCLRFDDDDLSAPPNKKYRVDATD